MKRVTFSRLRLAEPNTHSMSRNRTLHKDVHISHRMHHKAHFDLLNSLIFFCLFLSSLFDSLTRSDILTPSKIRRYEERSQTGSISVEKRIFLQYCSEEILYYFRKSNDNNTALILLLLTNPIRNIPQHNDTTLS